MRDSRSSRNSSELQQANSGRSSRRPIDGRAMQEKDGKRLQRGSANEAGQSSGVGRFANDRRGQRPDGGRQDGANRGNSGRGQRPNGAMQDGANRGNGGRGQRPNGAMQDGKKGALSKRQSESISNSRTLVVRLFAGILALGCILGFAMFLRPATSEAENRNLTEFPTFSWETFVDGEFFSDLSLWYADTYPFRDQLVGLDLALKSTFGISTDVQMIGGNEAAEEIPDENQAAVEEFPYEKVEAPNERVMAQDIQNSITKGLYVKNGAAYSIYYFSKKSVQRYAKALNECANELQGVATVYSLLVPNNSGAMLSESELKDLGGSDQAQAIKYFDSLFNNYVMPVDVLDALREHNDEYIFFRTDHHWTQLGAYYAYLCYCQVAGINPVDIDTLDTETFQPFLGAFYQQLNNEAMKNNPDYVETFIPASTNEMKYKKQNGKKWIKSKVIQDVNGWNPGSLYSTFVAGDEPLVKIENPELNDGSSVLVVKDSFGNAFVPWLVDNYQYVYVIDFRYYDGKIPEFVIQNDIQNVIFLNNISMAGTKTVADKLLTMM